MYHGLVGIDTIFRVASSRYWPSSGILRTLKWYWIQLHLIMFHSLKKNRFLLFPCTWRIPYYDYAIISILIYFKTTRHRAYCASSLEALVFSCIRCPYIIYLYNIMCIIFIKITTQYSSVTCSFWCSYKNNQTSHQVYQSLILTVYR